jgi:hypothetical protein
MLQPLLFWQGDTVNICWTVIQHVPFIHLRLTDVAPFMLLGSDKTTWRIGVLVWPKWSGITTTKPWLEFCCLCEKHSGPLVLKAHNEPKQETIECLASMAILLRPKKRTKVEEFLVLTIAYMKNKRPDQARKKAESKSLI